MKCDSCKHCVADFPTHDDPLASPHCAKGHWEGTGASAAEEDPWAGCADWEWEHNAPGTTQGGDRGQV